MKRLKIAEKITSHRDKRCIQNFNKFQNFWQQNMKNLQDTRRRVCVTSNLNRQTNMINQWAKANGYSPSEIIIRRDEGVSAYHGDNLKQDAELGRFIIDAEKGLIPAGSILLTENHDRGASGEDFRLQRAVDCLSG